METVIKMYQISEDGDLLFNNRIVDLQTLPKKLSVYDKDGNLAIHTYLGTAVLNTQIVNIFIDDFGLPFIAEKDDFFEFVGKYFPETSEGNRNFYKFQIQYESIFKFNISLLL